MTALTENSRNAKKLLIQKKKGFNTKRIDFSFGAAVT